MLFIRLRFRPYTVVVWIRKDVYDIVLFCVCSRRDGNVMRGSGVRELRRDFHTIVEARRHRPLLVQRVWTLPQDERHEQALSETTQTAG